MDDTIEMDEEEYKKCLKYFEASSEESDFFDFEEIGEIFRPLPPIQIDPRIHKIIKIGPKNVTCGASSGAPIAQDNPIQEADAENVPPVRSESQPRHLSKNQKRRRKKKREKRKLWRNRQTLLDNKGNINGYENGNFNEIKSETVLSTNPIVETDKEVIESILLDKNDLTNNSDDNFEDEIENVITRGGKKINNEKEQRTQLQNPKGNYIDRQFPYDGYSHDNGDSWHNVRELYLDCDILNAVRGRNSNQTPEQCLVVADCTTSPRSLLDFGNRLEFWPDFQRFCLHHENNIDCYSTNNSVEDLDLENDTLCVKSSSSFSANVEVEGLNAQEEGKKLEALEMWVYRRILKISWMDRITNQEVLRRLGKEKELTLAIRARKLQYLGHVTRGEKYQFLQFIMQARNEKKRNEARRKMTWLRNLKEWICCTSNQLFRSALSRSSL